MDIFDESFYFNSQFYFPQSPEHSFLDIDEYVLPDSTHHTSEAQIVPASPQRKLSDPFGPEPSFIPFQPLKSTVQVKYFPEQISIEQEVTPIKVKSKIAPSIVTKNVCYNICQKTIKVIQKDLYEAKLLQICEKNETTKSAFIKHIVQQKKNFTGPKALQNYIEQDNAFSATFREFMRWFLKEKYLRHCLGGDMDNKEAYIKYKNEVILVILG